MVAASGPQKWGISDFHSDDGSLSELKGFATIGTYASAKGCQDSDETLIPVAFCFCTAAGGVPLADHSMYTCRKKGRVHFAKQAVQKIQCAAHYLA